MRLPLSEDTSGHAVPLVATSADARTQDVRTRAPHLEATSSDPTSSQKWRLVEDVRGRPPPALDSHAEADPVLPEGTGRRAIPSPDSADASEAVQPWLLEGRVAADFKLPLPSVAASSAHGAADSYGPAYGRSVGEKNSDPATALAAQTSDPLAAERRMELGDIRTRGISPLLPPEAMPGVINQLPSSTQSLWENNSASISRQSEPSPSSPFLQPVCSVHHNAYVCCSYQ
jgi:hypothetical protein